MSSKNLFLINRNIVNENGLIMLDQWLVTGPETQEDIELVDFYRGLGKNAVTVFIAPGNAPNQNITPTAEPDLPPEQSPQVHFH